MSTSYLESPLHINPEESFAEDHLQQTLQAAIRRFDFMARSSAIIHFLFWAALIGEMLTFFIFLTFLLQSSLLAIGLAVLFFTLFSYLMFRVYEKSSKPEKVQGIQEQTLHACKTWLHYEESTSEYPLRLASICCRLSDQFEGKEYQYYRPMKQISFLTPVLEKMSFWMHWQDVYRMRELLLQTAVQEHLKMVRCEPTSLDVHARLANAYVMLSGLYLLLSKKQNGGTSFYFGSQDPFFEEKFRHTVQKAIEEFKILLDYAPHDTWVRMQLAYSYHDLNMPMEEIQEYEAILQINPNDPEVMYKLGTLYFQQGLNAKGLRIYEALRHHHYKKAESLIALYGIPPSSF